MRCMPTAESRLAIPLPSDEEKHGKESVGKKMRFYASGESGHQGSRSLWSAEDSHADDLAAAAGDSKKKPIFVIQAQPSIANRHIEKDEDALVSEKGCLPAIQPRIVRGPKLLAVWRDTAKPTAFSLRAMWMERKTRRKMRTMMLATKAVKNA